jgi:peptide-methionine (S)-S-oxide reductase
METEVIVLGAGCFWCTEAVFSVLKGVKSTMPGYSGGTSPNPTYEEVCTGLTGHAEVVRVEFDPEVLRLKKIFDIFFMMHDPTSLNRQGADIGTQYRSVIFYTSDEQLKAADEYIAGLQRTLSRRIVTEVRPLGRFYPAEGYHKDYFLKNPGQGYCSFVIKPKVEKISKYISSEKDA